MTLFIVMGYRNKLLIISKFIDTARQTTNYIQNIVNISLYKKWPSPAITFETGFKKLYFDQKHY